MRIDRGVVLPEGIREELTRFPIMISVMEGYKTFGPLQMKRIDWKQEMFAEEEKPELE